MTNKSKFHGLIDKLFHDKLTEVEVKEAIHYLAEDKNSVDLDSIMKEHWEKNKCQNTLSEEDFVLLLNKLHHKINLIEENNRKLKNQVHSQRYKYSRTLGILTRVAAVLFIPLLLASILIVSDSLKNKIENTKMAYFEVYTPLAAKTHFVLPDSSVVWLNSGSNLKYPTSFSKEVREVYLSGEGYFEVKHNPDIPFIVKTDKVNISVYGTEFNIMAYSNEPLVTATLVAGSIKVEENDNGNSLYVMPEQQFSLNKTTGNHSLEKIDVQSYTSWKDGKITFNNESLDVVARKMERWFNCKIYLDDTDLKQYKYTGTIEMETLREILELISLTTPIKTKYKKETREIWIEHK